jgi:hypothetical protein
LMTPADLSSVLGVAQNGATLAASGESDVSEFTIVSDLIGDCLERLDLATLREFEARIRKEVPQSLPWYLSILRTLAGTVPFEDFMHHLVLIPVCSKEPVHQQIELGEARHEIEGSLESALNLGSGTLRLLPHAASYEALAAMSPIDWLQLACGVEDSDAPLYRAEFGAQGGALVGRWSIERSDKARLARKLVHATQRTPQLVSWQQRTSALLEERARGAALTVYPALQLQDFFSGLRQFQLVRALESAFRQLPLAQVLQWGWVDDEVVCSLTDATGRYLKIRSQFPDEPHSVVRERLRGFCTRRGLRPEPELA